MADNTSSQCLPSSIQADAVQHQWPGSMRSDPGQQLRPNSDGFKPISPSTRRPPAANWPTISSVRESSPSVDDRAPARRQSSPSMPSGQHRSAPSSSSVFTMGRPRATVQPTPTLHSTHLQRPTATARSSQIHLTPTSRSSKSRTSARLTTQIRTHRSRTAALHQ
ncbi:hypothetical protein ACLOJK_022662 [Asimina triloba]